ncbi:MAG: hypothetical protein HYS04_17555 [Acidobacteria bacterium]|nr:hypothetical protein [Acidobacteriota bacterium]
MSTAIGSGTTASSGITAATQAPRELLYGVIGVEGPGDDPPGTFLNSYTSYFDDHRGFGTTGQGASSNITLHVGVRTVNTTGEYFVTKTGLANRDWAALVATYRGLQQ